MSLKIDKSPFLPTRQADFARHSSSAVIAYLRVFLISIAWGSAIFAVLNQVGVIAYLSGFNADFRYISGVTPLTSPWAVVALISGYIISLPCVKWCMRNRKPVAFPTFMLVHNGFLVVSSFLLAVGILTCVARDTYNHGFYHSICSYEVNANPYLQAFYYLNYLLKYYEFVDTYIILLKKKDVIFLHWYHHAATALLTYIQQNDYTPVQWVPIVVNLLIHVIMYSYYLLSALHFRVWWKQYLTQLQILQFLLDLVACGFCSWQLTKSPPACDGTRRAAFSGVGIIGSYFLLFLNFYVVSYSNKNRIKGDFIVCLSKWRWH